MDDEKLRWKVTERAADVALAAVPLPLRVLDIGCDDGALVRELVVRLPNVLEITGVDPDERRIEDARQATEGFPRFRQAYPEHLPFPDEHFDLVVTALSYAGWVDQVRGLQEVARVLKPAGALVLADVTPPKEVGAAVLQAGLRPGRSEVLVRRYGVLPLARAFIAYR